MKVPFIDIAAQNRPLRDEILAAIADVFDNSRFCLGADVEAFESDFAREAGAEQALAVHSGTAALHLASLVHDLGPGDEVIVPPFTFISTAWCGSHVGAKLVFADIDEETMNLDPYAVEAAVTPRTRAIVVVHLFGQAAPMDQIMGIAKRHDLRVIEDCAQAHGACYRDRPVGMIGDAGCYSFYPTKNLGGCGEGGAFVSRHAPLFRKASLLRNHGSDRRYYHDLVGYNYRMDGFQGAALRIKLRYLSGWTQKRRQNARRYREELQCPELILPADPEYGESVYHQFTIRHPRRDDLRQFLEENGVATGIFYPVPIHLQEAYAYLDYKAGAFPVAERAAGSCLSLPIFPELTEEQLDHVIACVRAFGSRAGNRK